jgi:hypothetical protein
MNAASQLLQTLESRGVSVTFENVTERGAGGAIVPAKRLWMRGPDAWRFWEPVRLRRAEVIALLEARGAQEADFAERNVPSEEKLAVGASVKARMKKETK